VCILNVVRVLLTRTIRRSWYNNTRRKNFKFIQNLFEHPQDKRSLWRL